MTRRGEYVREEESSLCSTHPRAVVSYLVSNKPKRPHAGFKVITDDGMVHGARRQLLHIRVEAQGRNGILVAFEGPF
jgi:hypothetical protein